MMGHEQLHVGSCSHSDDAARFVARHQAQKLCEIQAQPPGPQWPTRLVSHQHEAALLHARQQRLHRCAALAQQLQLPCKRLCVGQGCKAGGLGHGAKPAESVVTHALATPPDSQKRSQNAPYMLPPSAASCSPAGRISANTGN